MAARQVLLGIFLNVMAGVSVTAEMAFSIAMLEKMWPYWRITAISCLLAMAGVFVLLALLRRPVPDREQMKWVFMLGLFSAIYWGLGVVAVQIGVDPGDVAALTSINIVMAAIMGRVFLKETFRVLHGIAVVFSLAGALLIARPAFIFSSERANGTPWYGYVAAMVSGVLQGGFFICGRKAGDVSAGYLTSSALSFSAILCTLLPLLPLIEEAPFRVALESPREGLLWTGIAFLTTACSAGFSVSGSMYCPAAISATVYTASSMFFGYVVQSMFFGSTPEPITICGACLMLAAVSLMAFAGSTEEFLQRAAQSVLRISFGDLQEDKGGSEQQPEEISSPAADDDDESLASFIASEFSDFDAKDRQVRFRGHAGQHEVVPPQLFGIAPLTLSI